MTTDTLLPQNATAQEIALETAMRPSADLLAAIDLVRTAKEAPPDDWLYWLIWEYGLEVLLPYLDDPRFVLERGLQWQRVRGTPASLDIAFDWIGLGDTIIEEEETGGAHWFEYMLDPGRVPTREELRKLVGLARVSQPLRSRLSRVFHGEDLRRAIWDYTAWSDGSLWSDNGGAYDPDLGVDLSFGRVHQSVAVLGPVEVYFQQLRRITSVAVYVDKLQWDESEYDEPVPILNYNIGGESIMATTSEGVGRNQLVADGRFIADGTMRAGSKASEVNQYPVVHSTEDFRQIISDVNDAIPAIDDFYYTVNTDLPNRID